MAAKPTWGRGRSKPREARLAVTRSSPFPVRGVVASEDGLQVVGGRHVQEVPSRCAAEPVHQPGASLRRGSSPRRRRRRPPGGTRAADASLPRFSPAGHPPRSGPCGGVQVCVLPMAT